MLKTADLTVLLGTQDQVSTQAAELLTALLEPAGEGMIGARHHLLHLHIKSKTRL